MEKKPLIGVSILAVVLLVLGSLSNVVGYQTVQSSNQNTINNEVNQKELLFQTIVDIANNKEIQRIILKSQIMSGKFFDPDAKLSTPVTKQQLRQMYFIGLMLSKIFSRTKIHSMVERYQMINQGMHKDINAVIEKDATLKGEMTQLSESKCDCGNANPINWSFPVLCVLLYPLLVISVVLLLLLHYHPFYEFMEALAKELNCFWAQPG